jgi:LigD-like primase-polymerase
LCRGSDSLAGGSSTRPRHGSSFHAYLDRIRHENQGRHHQPGSRAVSRSSHHEGRSRGLLPHNSRGYTALDGRAAGQPYPLSAGRAKKCFFQKHDAGSFGDKVKHVANREKNGSSQPYLFLKNADGLLTCVQIGTIEFHERGARIEDVEKNRPPRV